MAKARIRLSGTRASRKAGGTRSGKDTRLRLLKVAADQFAEQGFRNTRIQDICRTAGANVAAVNYHFGGKESLYKAVWDYALEQAIEESAAVDLSTDKDREWLYHYLRVCVLSLFDTGNSGLLRRLIANEVNEPSPVSDEVLSEHLVPRVQELEARLRRMMDPHVTDFQVGCCILAIHSQFSAITIHRSARRKLFKNDQPSAEEAERFAREICAFVIGGIRAIRGVPPAARRLRAPAKDPASHAAH
ncbi:MAG: TetR/AcrR family transcriptional regulator [Kiritimatiellia bacterium]|jgi:AcrR family transcriptional regulator